MLRGTLRSRRSLHHHARTTPGKLSPYYVPHPYMHVTPFRRVSRRWLRLVFALAIAAIVHATAQSQEPPYPADSSRKPSPPDPRTMSGPWDQDIVVYRVPPSAAAEKLITFERGGVATAARLGDGRLAIAHQHFPENNRANFDKVAIHFSTDEGRTWTKPEVIRLAGLPAQMRFPFDPTLVPLPDGRTRLYFTSRRLGRAEGLPAIFSAISKNALEYTFEPEVRFGVEGRAVIDCAVVLHRGEFHLFAPDNGVGHPSDRDEISARKRIERESVPDTTPSVRTVSRLHVSPTSRSRGGAIGSATPSPTGT